MVSTTYDPNRKRLMLYCPEINPSSFVFFFEKGEFGYAFSVRDYSNPNQVILRYSRDFGCTASQLRAKARHICDAPYLDVNRVSEWHAYTKALNATFGLSGSRPADQPFSCRHLPRGQYPIVNGERFLQLPKAAKVLDVRRMVESPKSEDWTTWTVMNLLLGAEPKDWWAHILHLVSSDTGAADLPSPAERPEIDFWPTVASPAGYERASRERMRTSSDPALVARSHDPNPVEGKSEIDLAFDGSTPSSFTSRRSSTRTSA